MFITVGICTFNRAKSLRRTLDSLTALRAPEGVTWEIVVVNNNSTDHTDQVIEEYRGRLPVRREFEPQPGKSNALNRAIDVARGEYILWTDDDVIVDPGWLAAYAAAFRRWPQAALFGGRIIPKLEQPVRRWVAESLPVLAAPYAVRDFGDDEQMLSVAEDRVPYGANFAIRAVEQRAFRYDPDLGPSPSHSRYGEDEDVIARVLSSGATGYWVPQAVVEHCIGQERQTVKHVVNYSMTIGETHAYRYAAAGKRARLWFGVPRELWATLAKRWLRYQLHRRISPAPIWVAHLQSYAHAKGMLRYWRKRRDENALDLAMPRPQWHH
jgi:glycosyltransferase involved in cell wall biosynthesis